MMLIIKHLLINKLVFLGFHLLKLRLRLHLLRTAIILCMKFQSKSYTYIKYIYNKLY